MSTGKRILVCGSLHWTDARMIWELLKKLKPSLVIEGEAPGADKLARAAAEKLGILVIPYPADWNSYGRAAGPIRNSAMLNLGKPDEVHAFHDDPALGIGTADMVKKARAAGVPVFIHSH